VVLIGGGGKPLHLVILWLGPRIHVGALVIYAGSQHWIIG
jgi:hypothetical protein